MCEKLSSSCRYSFSMCGSSTMRPRVDGAARPWRGVPNRLLNGDWNVATREISSDWRMLARGCDCAALLVLVLLVVASDFAGDGAGEDEVLEEDEEAIIDSCILFPLILLSKLTS